MPTLPDRVIVVRHGQTEWNVEGRRQGQLDSSLTAKGRRHAEQMANTGARLGVDAIFTSPLGRACETADIIGSGLDRPVEVVDDLAEVHHGAFAGLTNSEIDQRFPGARLQREGAKYSWAFPGGESYADADARAGRALDRIANANVAVPMIVTHEMIGRMLFRSLLALGVDDALRLTMPHGAMFEVLTATKDMNCHHDPDVP